MKGESAPSVHRESTNSLIRSHRVYLSYTEDHCFILYEVHYYTPVVQEYMAINYCEVLKNDMDIVTMTACRVSSGAMVESGIHKSMRLMSLVQHTCCNLHMSQGTHHILHVHTSSTLQ